MVTPEFGGRHRRATSEKKKKRDENLRGLGRRVKKEAEGVNLLECYRGKGDKGD